MTSNSKVAFNFKQPAKKLGRKSTIQKKDIINAALSLAGPYKSVSSIALRELAREAGISPNSVYRHFLDMDELAIAVIEQAGALLKEIVLQARQQRQITSLNESKQSVIRAMVEIFVQLLNGEDNSLRILLREAHLGSSQFQKVAQQQLAYFEQQLIDLHQNILE